MSVTSNAKRQHIRPETRIIDNIVPRERALMIYDLKTFGYSEDMIIQAVFEEYYAAYVHNSRNRSDRRRTVQKQVRRVLSDPRYNPYMDEMAMERAYDGDADVWFNLTHYERLEVVDRLVDTYSNKPFHRHWPTFNNTEGVSLWAESVGEQATRIKTIAWARHGRSAEA